jgi:putative flippase GtrA
MEAGLMWVGVSALGVNDRIMKLLTQVAIIIANYVLSKLLVFRKKDRQD